MSVNNFYQSPVALGKVVVPAPQDGADTSSYRAEFSATTALAANDVIEMGPLPAGCTVVQVILDSDDLDSNGSPTITLDVGLLTGDYGALLDGAGAKRDLINTGSPEIFAASNVAQAGGVATPVLKTAYRIAEAGVDQSVGIKVHAGAATAAAGKIGLTVIYRG